MNKLMCSSVSQRITENDLFLLLMSLREKSKRISHSPWDLDDLSLEEVDVIEITSDYPEYLKGNLCIYLLERNVFLNYI